jgi:pimeloyl-ACP methyl ester carboxylesterase
MDKMPAQINLSATIAAPTEDLELRLHGPNRAPTLIYLPGLHGDWTLVGGFREAVAGAVRFVEITYPRTLEWSLEDYAEAVDDRLARAGVQSGWLLAESFGSQVAWSLIGRANRSFEVQAMILAGGFVRHPLPRMVGVCARVLNRVSLRSLHRSLRGYAWYARGRRGGSPARRAELEEFIARRTELDLKAAVHRLKLIQGTDLRPTAAATRLPVYYLTGFLDPVVPWPPVWRWLKRHCPGYGGGRLIGRSDHNVLSSVRPAAGQVLAWMRVEK